VKMRHSLVTTAPKCKNFTTKMNVTLLKLTRSTMVVELKREKVAT